MIEPLSSGDLNCYLIKWQSRKLLMTSARGVIPLTSRFPSCWP